MKAILLPALKMLGFIPLLLLLGCWDRSEINDLAIVTALAFDSADNGQIRVTAELVVPQAQSGGQMGGGGISGGSSKRTTTRSTTGFDAADALSKLQRLIPRRLFWGQCKVFIFSEAVSRAGIQKHLDLLLRYPPIRERSYLYVSKGRAATALTVFPVLERSSSEVLRELNDLRIGMRVTLQELSGMLTSDARAAGLPLVHILPKETTAEPFQTIPYVLGTAVFHQDTMIGEISERTTRGVLWLRNEIREYTVVFEVPGTDARVSLRPIKSTVRVTPSIVGDDWIITVKVRAEGDVIQNESSLGPMDLEVLERMEEGFRKEIDRRIRLALDEVQQRLNADIFDFATTSQISKAMGAGQGSLETEVQGG